MQIEDLLEILPNKYGDTERELILRAHRVAAAAHVAQTRASGEPYITHCVAVAYILARLRVPPTVIAAGLLHDTVEDTELTLDDVRRDFGDEVTALVDGVTKLTELPRVSRGDQPVRSDSRTREPNPRDERRELLAAQAEMDKRARTRKAKLVNETLRKTFLAMGKDPRIPLIKLVDRLHNMRTLKYMPEEKQRRIAQQTMDIFAPLANRMGIWQIKWELEDLGFRYTNSDMYKEIARKLAGRRSEREARLEKITEQLLALMKNSGIQADISGRPKHIYSIYRKMMRKGVPFEQVHDVRGVRIMVPEVQDCYAALGILHTQKKWKPIPKEFDDYIAAPKDNFYRSLHTAVIYEDGKQLEIQIRTKEMHQHAEYGIAAHWIYKEAMPHDEDFMRDMLWLRKLVDWGDDEDDEAERDPEEFVDAIKSDVFQDRVYVFTPRGDIIDLPGGSTPIDFAYHVHTDVGHRCRGAKVNGKLVNLSYRLKTGDQVDILTAKRGGPSRDWLNSSLGLVHSQRTRGKIRRWFRRQAREQNISQGKALLERELRRLGLSQMNQDSLAQEFDYRNTNDFYVAIACGDLPLRRIVNHLTFEEAEKEKEELFATSPVQDPSRGEISVLGLQGLLTAMARCCNPAPGDEIIGYITRGRGATIHRKDCPNILSVRDPERLVSASWGLVQEKYAVSVRVRAFDRNGLTKDVSIIIADEGVGISEATVRTQKHMAVFDLVLNVGNIEQLSRILNRIEQLPNVRDAQRITPG